MSLDKTNKENFLVLLVDDNNVYIDELGEFIRKSGFSVLTAPNANKALEILRENDIHMLISDIDMPVLSGLDLARLVKSRYPSVLIVLMTGETGFFSPVEAISAGADKFIAKPFKFPEMVGIINKFAGAPPPCLSDIK